MLTISGMITGVGSFTRKNGTVVHYVELFGLQVNLSGPTTYMVGDEVELRVVVALFNGRPQLTAVL